MPPIKRPRQSATNVTNKVKVATPELKVRRIKTEVNRAVASVAKVETDGHTNRSTRTRHVLKAKADAFDAIAEIAAGRR